MSALAQRLLSNPEPYGGELFQRVFRNGNFYSAPQLDAPGEFDFTAADNPNGSFAYIARDGAGNITGNPGFPIIPSHLSIAIEPEPATCVLVLTAVGLLRRRGLRRN